MPTYRVIKKSWLNDENGAPRLYKSGAIVEYDGQAGSNLELLDAAARKRLERDRSHRPQRSPAEVGTRLDNLEDAVGPDALKAASDKRQAEEKAEREKAAAEVKAADDAEKAKRAEAAKAKVKAEADAEKAAAPAKPSPEPAASPATP